MFPQKLDVIKFQKRCNPFDDIDFMGTGFVANCWGVNGKITRNDIKIAIKTSNLISPGANNNSLDSSLEHIARIAWFVVNGWNEPIDVDVGIPSLGCYPAWPLEDGNHRFAAAIFRGDCFILAYVSGATSEIQKFLWKEKNHGRQLSRVL